jgi:Tfp pilus assembly protein PilF
LKSNDEKLLMFEAELLYALKKFDRAVVAFRRVGKLEGPHAGRALQTAGYVARQMKDFAASKADFMRAARHGEEKGSALTALRQIQPATIK